MSDHSTDKKDQIFDLTLMSNFVHQVVNPLNAVCGTLDNIANGDVPVGSIKQRVRASRSQIEYCVELIRNLAFLAEYHRDPEGYAKQHGGAQSTAAAPQKKSTASFQPSSFLKVVATPSGRSPTAHIGAAEVPCAAFPRRKQNAYGPA